MDDTYLTLQSPSTGLYKEKGSKFLAFAFPVESEDEIKQRLSEIKKKYFDARHHCYAYALGYKREIFRMNDDGEPSSTGGKPIYGQILSNNLTNVLIIVVRYFGGVKLGVSGLIQAYKLATVDCLAAASVIEKIIEDTFVIIFDYEAMNLVMKILKDYNITSKHHNFDTTCRLEFSIRKTLSAAIVDKFRTIPNLILTTSK
ncbi:MAG: YigZ family protein [Bacteroidales bacterium]|jgi:uncharacterized YigZ family protein|nr:YigZ family protein [Bacteroidales bacterium]